MKTISTKGVGSAAATGLLCALTHTCGCASKPPPVWVPSPQVHWVDVSLQELPPVNNEYTILLAEPSEGLFPAAIGVTRLAVAPSQDESSTRRLCLVRDPRNEFLMWNTAFDDQMAISEVFPIALRDLGGAQVDAEQVLAANRALHAEIALVYAVNELSETETEMFGVLYDANTAESVAAFHAHAQSIPPSEDADEASDMWVTDSKALARAKFEATVYACVRELILSDQPPPIEAPTGWTPEGPTMPVEWPPTQFRTGR